MKNWIEVRVRGNVDGHEFDRTMTGDGAVVHVMTEKTKDKFEGGIAILGEWSVARLTSHLMLLEAKLGEKEFVQALMQMLCSN